MEQFKLDTWLKDKSRKVVTRDGRPVRIVCWDVKSISPIIGIIQDRLGGEFARNYALNGRYSIQNESEYDLFFADEEEKEELSEFEKELQTMISDASHWTSDDGSISTYCQFGDKEIKKISGQILDLARKEIEKKFVLLAKEDYQTAFDLGKAELLKYLPKWKRCMGSTGPFIDYDSDGEEYLYLNDYAIKISELEKLPKE